jgi:hypothetical protein
VTSDRQGKDFVAVVRLSDRAGRTLVEPGETCERIPAPPNGSLADTLAKMLAAGMIAQAPVVARKRQR